MIYTPTTTELTTLEKLRDVGARVVYFEDGSFFIYTFFVPADGKGNMHHKVTGKRIFPETDQKLRNMTNDTIQLTIDSIKEYSLWLHPDIKYICFE